MGLDGEEWANNNNKVVKCIWPFSMWTRKFLWAIRSLKAVTDPRTAVGQNYKYIDIRRKRSKRKEKKIYDVLLSTYHSLECPSFASWHAGGHFVMFCFDLVKFREIFFYKKNNNSFHQLKFTVYFFSAILLGQLYLFLHAILILF